MNPNPKPRLGPGAECSRYGQTALAREVGTLRQATPGVRNLSLNRSAFSLGQLVGGGELEQSTVKDALEDAALAIGLDRSEARSTIRSGMRAGVKHPRSAPGQKPHRRPVHRPAVIPAHVQALLLGRESWPLEWQAAKVLARLPDDLMRQDVLSNWDYLCERCDIAFVVDLARMLRRSRG